MLTKIDEQVKTRMENAHCTQPRTTSNLKNNCINSLIVAQCFENCLKYRRLFLFTYIFLLLQILKIKNSDHKIKFVNSVFPSIKRLSI